MRERSERAARYMPGLFYLFRYEKGTRYKYRAPFFITNPAEKPTQSRRGNGLLFFRIRKADGTILMSSSLIRSGFRMCLPVRDIFTCWKART